MATFDAVGVGAKGDGISSLSWNHTCAASARLAIGAQWALEAFGTANTPTYNSSALTAVTSAAATVATNYSTKLWHHATPTSGTNSCAISFTGTLDACASSVSVTSANAPADGNSATGTSTAIAVTVASAASGDIVVDAALGINTVSVGADQTSRWNLGVQAIGFWGAGSTQLGASGGAMTWTQSSSDNWATCAFRFPDSGAAANTDPPFGVTTTQRKSMVQVMY